MSVARITTITFNSKQAADKASESYIANAPNEFPEAEQLIGIKIYDRTLTAVTLYENNEAMERANAARSKRIDSNNDVASVDTKIGTVNLNHSNKN